MQQEEQGLTVTPAASDRRVAAYQATDAMLLELVRARNTTAYDILVTRHVEAARRLAHITVGTADADRVVAEAFAEVRDAMLLGGGPSDAFRPYLLTVLRRVSADLQSTQVPAGTLQLPGPADLPSAPEVTDLGTSPIVRAFRALPERWIAVLWHTEVEKTSAADVTRILGVDQIGIAPLRDQALDGLRQAYLQVRMSQAAGPECEQAVRRLATFFWGMASRRAEAIATRHLGRCGECRGMYSQFADIEVALHSVVARAVLGPAATAYTHAARPAGARAGAAEVAARTKEVATTAPAGAEAFASADARALRPVRGSWYASRRLRWLGAGAVAALAVVAASLLVVVAGGSTMLTRAHHAQPAGAAPAEPPAISPQPGRHPAVPPPSSAAPGHTPSAGVITISLTSPAASGPPVPAELSATVDVRGSDAGFTYRVAFAVADAGGSATGELTASLELPGSALESAQLGSFSESTNGWNCQQTQTGVSCRHDGIQAGSRVGGSLLISITMPEEACGRPVSLTAVSGTASDSAQSPEGIQCDRQRSDSFSERRPVSAEMMETILSLRSLNARPGQRLPGH